MRLRFLGARSLAMAALLGLSSAGAHSEAAPQARAEADEVKCAGDGEVGEAGDKAGYGDPDEEALAEFEEVDEAPDALRDPYIAKVIRPRVVIDRPRFSLETGGKIQVQYYDADSDDEFNEDEVFLRRFRPRLLGRLWSHWVWRLEAELSADIQRGDVDLNELDIRDFYVRYMGFRRDGWRLTFGNQKTPFSRDFLTPSISQLLIERTFVGDLDAGVPERKLGAHFRGESLEGKVAYWASVGGIGVNPDANRIRFESLVGGSGNLNEGIMVSGRLDLHPRGGMTFSDGDQHTPVVKYTWSLAGYSWENDGRTNRFTEGGEPIDPERVDLDSAIGVELSGGLRGRGVSLDWQYNLIRADTVVDDFTGGIFVGGSTQLDAVAMEGSYWFRGTPVELGGAVTELDADGFADTWGEATLQLNLHYLFGFASKIQISHTWIDNRFGVVGEDLRETRVQIQYVW